MPPYREPHWTQFISIPHSPQGAVGVSPASWVSSLGLSGVPQSILRLHTPLTRQAVLVHCTTSRTPLLFGYVCAMAWGGQGSGPGATANAHSAWAALTQLLANLSALRTGGLTRGNAYSLFQGSGKIAGLGPSYFTKLLHFFSLNVPTGEQPYIVDNVILRSMALLTGFPFHCHATRGGYQACCEEIDAMAILLGSPPQDVEERLFSAKSAPWRRYVLKNKSALHECLGREAYRNAMHQAYPHIPRNCF